MTEADAFEEARRRFPRNPRAPRYPRAFVDPRGRCVIGYEDAEFVYAVWVGKTWSEVIAKARSSKK